MAFLASDQLAGGRRLTSSDVAATIQWWFLVHIDLGHSGIWPYQASSELRKHDFDFCLAKV